MSHSSSSIRKNFFFVFLAWCCLAGTAMAQNTATWSFASRIQEEVKVLYPSDRFDEATKIESPTIVIYLHPPRDTYNAKNVETHYPQILLERVRQDSALAHLLGDELKEIGRGSLSMLALREYQNELTNYANAKIHDYGLRGVSHANLILVDRLKLKGVGGQEPKIPLQYRYALEYQVVNPQNGQPVVIGEEAMIVQSLRGATYQFTYRDLLGRYKKEQQLRETIFQNVELAPQSIDTKSNSTHIPESQPWDMTSVLLNIVAIAACGVFLYSRWKKNRQGIV